MTNPDAIVEIDKAIILLQGIKAGLQAQAAPVVDPPPAPIPSPTPAPLPAPAPAPIPPTTEPLTATLLGRDGDFASGAKAGVDGQLDVHIRLTGLPADVVGVTIRDGKGAGAFWTHDAKNSWIVVFKPSPGGVCDLYFTYASDYPSYKVEIRFTDGTTASLVTGTPAGPAPLPAPAPSPEPTPPTFPSVIIPGSRTGAIPYDDRNCSAIMDGDVVCNIVLLESDSTTHTGTQWDENWNDAEKQAIWEQALKASAWYVEAYKRAVPNAKHPLRFQFNTQNLTKPVVVSYEPITTKFSDRALWMRQAMGKLGYGGSDYIGNCRKFNHASRVTAGADWALTMFIIDSQNDSDGKFADGMSCWAYFNGPACYLTSDGGSWGTDRLWRCMVHEIAHCFGPRDTYAGSGSTYNDTMGYLYKVQNTNAVDGRPAGAPPQQPDIMAGASMQDASLAAYQVCRETAWALGWIPNEHGVLVARGQ